jgi:hypothetical protein
MPVSEKRKAEAGERRQQKGDKKMEDKELRGNKKEGCLPSTFGVWRILPQRRQV